MLFIKLMSNIEYLLLLSNMYCFTFTIATPGNIIHIGASGGIVLLNKCAIYYGIH